MRRVRVHQSYCTQNLSIPDGMRSSSYRLFYKEKRHPKRDGLELRFCVKTVLVEVTACKTSAFLTECESSSYQLFYKEKDHPEWDGLFLGGVGETRTLAPVTRPTPLAGAPRHQLEYYSVCRKIGCGEQPIRADSVVKKVWRRGRDSNPWLFRVTGFQDRLLKPLGHLSVQSTQIILALSRRFVKT